jgi:hypothetical protein
VKEIRLHDQEAPTCRLCRAACEVENREMKTSLLSANTRINAENWQVGEIVTEDQAR